MGWRSLVERGFERAGPPDPGRPGVRDAVAAALVAYAAGDAFGVAYEFLEQPIPVDTAQISGRAGWPLGGVSDDTTLTLLTIGAIGDEGPPECAARFLIDLRAAAPTLRGLGPTTRAALGLEVTAAETALVGATNGGLMRTALLGLAFDPDDDLTRRELVHALAFATHEDLAATVCAVLGSKLFSLLSAGAASPATAQVLRAEASALTEVPAAVTQMLDGLDDWRAPAAGVSLSPVETLAAVATVAAGSRSCLVAYRTACELGGDTDTVSALAAAAVAARDPHGCGLYSIPWLDDVQWAEVPQLAEAIASLIRLREKGSGSGVTPE
jgi:ADP-ribosyl-[dinitrogen reductase] hydrolase